MGSTSVGDVVGAPVVGIHAEVLAWSLRNEWSRRSRESRWVEEHGTELIV
jgi:hypothetical protein